MNERCKKWVITLSLSLFSMVLCHAADYNYNAGDIKSPLGSDGVSYTLSVSLSDLGAPSGLSFDTKSGVTTGSPSRISINVSSGSASGTIAYGTDELPTSDITMIMDGKLVGGDGDGTQPTWHASGKAVAPLYISPQKEFGVSYSFTAYRGDVPVSSVWNALTSGANLSTTSGSTVSVAPLVPGIYYFEAVNESEHASAVFIRLGVKFKDKKGTEISSIKVIKGGSENVTTELLPDNPGCTVSLSCSDSSFSVSGGVPGSVVITGNSIGTGTIAAKYENDTIATLGVEVVTAKITLSIVP